MPRRQATPALLSSLIVLASFPSLCFAQPVAAADKAVLTKKILAFGDSMTVGIFDDGDDDCDAPNFGYPARLSSRLAADGIVNVVANEGRCGEVTIDGVSRIDLALNRNADANVAIIMEGTNDLANPNVGVETMVFNIHEMARKAQVRRAWPVVVAPPPRNPEPWGSNARGATLAERLAEEAEAQNYDFLDLFEVFDTIDKDFNEYFHTDGLHWNTDGYDVVGIEMVAPTKLALARVTPAACVANSKTLCLSRGRFKVQVEWKTPVPQTGAGTAIPLTSDTGEFWFFSPNNLELVVKVLDGREINGYYWVFYGALSDVEYTITVTDSVTGRQRIYQNQQGALASVGDIKAFAEPLP